MVPVPEVSGVHQLEECIITIDGVRLKYLKIGRGDHVVVCLPGGVGTPMTDFEMQIRHFNRDQLTLLLWEPLGRGTNDIIRTVDNEFREMEAGYVEKVLDKTGIREFSILGYCNGGNVGIILAARNKNRVKKLVIFGVMAFVGPRECDIAENVVGDISKYGVKLRQSLEEAVGHDRLVRISSALANGVKVDYNKYGGRTSERYLCNVTADTMILLGDQDAFLSMDHVDFIAKNLKTLKRRVIIPGGKHYLQRHKFQEFNEAVENFLLSN